MKETKHRTLKLALIFSIIIFSIMTISMLLIGFVMIVLYYTGHLHELNILLCLIWFILPSLITGIAIAFLVAVKGLKPILKMCDAINKVAEGDFSVRLSEKYLIQEVSQMAECFNIMTKKLDNINTVHNDFINNASHEFRTPLSAIEGYAGLLGSEQLSTFQRIQYADQIMKVTVKLSSTLNNILFLSKISIEDTKIEKKPFNLSESIREVLIMLENKWEGKKIFINLELEDYIYWGNKEMLEEVWSNLIGNALKFSNVGGTLNIAAFQSKNIATIIISDNGIGMTKENQKKIYDKFFQAETSHSQEVT
ncbi:MAG: HAMP domain-containing sensor histidine kinase [Lachnospiraceae bacterium]|nr:HAMP domain-containing sensor histidine kinase [Lachnospiraceae bacterium]